MPDEGTLILRTKTRAGIDIDFSFDDATVSQLVLFCAGMGDAPILMSTRAVPVAMTDLG